MKPIYLVLSLLILAGCQSSQVPVNTSSGEPENAISSGIDGVYSGGEGYDPAAAAAADGYYAGNAAGYDEATHSDHFRDPSYGKNVVAGPRASAKDRIIYFAYDSSKIDARAESIIAEHAAYLKQHPNTKILLEGHTDSRGSREYNIALGERRAIAVLRRFRALGVPTSQIRVISYGEENPAVKGYSEEAYRRNRRAVIQY